MDNLKLEVLNWISISRSMKTQGGRETRTGQRRLDVGARRGRLEEGAEHDGAGGVASGTGAGRRGQRRRQAAAGRGAGQRQDAETEPLLRFEQEQARQESGRFVEAHQHDADADGQSDAGVQSGAAGRVGGVAQKRKTLVVVQGPRRSGADQVARLAVQVGVQVAQPQRRLGVGGRSGAVVAQDAFDGRQRQRQEFNFVDPPSIVSQPQKRLQTRLGESHIHCTVHFRVLKTTHNGTHTKRADLP